MMNDQKEIYLCPGAEFIISRHTIAEKLGGIKAFVFDWDGVFNDGEKQANGSSSFNEIDSMGINLLRFSHFLKHGKMAHTAIISGEKNETAFFYAKREHFNMSFYKFADKRIALARFCDAFGLKPNEICYFFDDVLDLPVAAVAGLRIFIPRPASGLFTQFVKQNQFADYMTACRSGQYALREACEMLMSAAGLFEQAVNHRVQFDDVYSQYLKLRNDTPTQFYTLSNGAVTQTEL